jgi:CheY-like chemotaxis protein
MNILYIEDNAQDRMLVERYINTTPHNLRAVSRLDDLDLSALSADLILLDILIDDRVLGLAYFEKIRTQGILCPIIAVTALVLPHQLAAYEEAGLDDVIEKPFEISKLAEVITVYAPYSGQEGS